MREIKIGLLATLHFYLQSFGSLDLCVLLRSAEETKKCQKSEGLSQFASLTDTHRLKKLSSFGGNV